MITFHNDHLVNPDLCKLIYDTVPVSLHVPVIFISRSKELGTLGRCHYDHIEIYLQTIYYSGWRKAKYPNFSLWWQLLETIYHEFGHIATYPYTKHLHGAYEERGYEYLTIEDAADQWANNMLDNLALFDRRLCQPERLGPYIDGREAKRRERREKYLRQQNTPDYSGLIDYRCRKSGGQYSITYACGEIMRLLKIDPVKQNLQRIRRAVRKLAADLAYTYTTKNGRALFFFAYGDLPEITRRVYANQKGKTFRAWPGTQEPAGKLAYLPQPVNFGTEGEIPF